MVQALLAKADAKQSISIVSLGGPLAATGQPTAAKITSIVGGITITDEVKAELVLNTKNADDAKALESELKDGIDQVKALVDLTANQNKDLKPLVDAVDTLKVSAQGATTADAIVHVPSQATSARAAGALTKSNAARPAIRVKDSSE